MTRRSTATVIAAMAMLLVIGTATRAKAGPAGLCQSASAPDCGGTAEDLACGDSDTNPQDCIDTGIGCGCQPRVCCSCENIGTSVACNVTGCTQTGIGLAACVSSCLILNQINTDGCNLKVVNSAKCASGSCNVTGCCQVTVAQANSSAVQSGILNECFETTEATCDLLDQLATFVPDGSCTGGLDGNCSSPTPTSTGTGTVTNTPTGTGTATNTPTGTGTATNTPTGTGTGTATTTPTGTATQSGTPTHTGTVTSSATQTGTATQTRTTSSTPTKTPVPNGGACVTPGQCASMFCVNGTCCNTACEPPFQSCSSGTCGATTAPVPALSPSALVFAAVALLLIGAVAMLVRVQRR